MKLIKDSTGIYKYITENREYQVDNGYPALNAFKCWILTSKVEETKYFKKLSEVKEYLKDK